LIVLSHPLFADVARAWQAAFGDRPVRTRDVLNLSIEQPDILRILTRSVPKLAQHPHPNVLTQWLRCVENLPIVLADQPTRLRFARVGYRWALVPLPAEVDRILAPPRDHRADTRSLVAA
jgi:hypothetical protein